MSTKGDLTRSKILANASQVFQRKGILATTVTDLLNATGTTKGNLYFHFSSKEDIGLEVLQKAHAAFNSFLDEALTGPTPGAALEHFFAGVLERNLAKGANGGCIFGNTALEAADTAPRFARLVQHVFNDWISRLESMVAAAQQRGQIRRDLPPVELAELIVETIEGAIMQARLQQETGPLARALNALRVVLELDSFAVSAPEGEAR
ncbi:TetR/AcrR family transcriptional regulator [Pelobacter seleniigenes]|uniref:TetR/AcrR family transcriptional regulator n=1 Tax=Pelobacter seleniigenes TaxID=407188 RepID=UPI0004A6D1A2|nr:TetR/AcrR family transcriptional regulator [Pelobacter seleniigenes]